MRNSVPRLTLLSLFASACCLWPQQFPVAESSRDLGRIEGRTVHSAAGGPVSKVNLTLRGSSSGSASATAVSDSEGSFSFRNLAPGKYTLLAEKSGFIREAYGGLTGGSLGTVLVLAAGGLIEDLEFRLTPQGVITGKVTDDQGEPVRGVMISWQFAPGPRGRSTGAAPFATANELGDFCLTNLLPGRYLLLATPQASMLRSGPPAGASGKVEEQLLTTWYPSAADLASAAPVSLSVGEEVAGIVIILRKGMVYRVQGKLLPTSAGEPFTSLTVQLVPRKPGRGRITSISGGLGNVQPDGSFELGNVEPDSYYLIAARVSERRLVGSIPVEVGHADVEGLVFQLGGLLQVSGAVRVEGRDTPSIASGRILLSRDVSAPFSSSAATVDPDGRFKMEDVQPERYRLGISDLPSDVYVKSVRLGSQDVTGEVLDLSSARSAAFVEVLLSLNAATLEGLVTDKDKPAAARWISLVPEPPRPERSYFLKSVTSDRAGKFTIQGIAPGEYKLYAWDEPQPDLLADAEYLKPLESQAVEVTIGENERVKVDVTVIKPEGVQSR